MGSSPSCAGRTGGKRRGRWSGRCSLCGTISRWGASADLNGQAVAWCDKVNGKVHAATNEIPLERLKCVHHRQDQPETGTKKTASSRILTTIKNQTETASLGFGLERKGKRVTIASALLDRVLHPRTVMNIKGESYRLKERKEFMRQKQRIVNTLFEQGNA